MAHSRTPVDSDEDASSAPRLWKVSPSPPRHQQNRLPSQQQQQQLAQQLAEQEHVKSELAAVSGLVDQLREQQRHIEALAKVAAEQERRAAASAKKTRADDSASNADAGPRLSRLDGFGFFSNSAAAADSVMRRNEQRIKNLSKLARRPRNRSSKSILRQQ